MTGSGTYVPEARRVSSPAEYLAEVDRSRVDMLRRVVTPMWQRVGWEPRFWLGRKHGDPIDEAREFARLAEVDGVVLVPRALLRALVERKECSARRDFHADEDGPTSWVTHAVCRVAEGHDGDHNNGYHRWSNVTAPASTSTRRGRYVENEESTDG